MLVFFFILGIRKDDSGVPEPEENFEEAIRNVNSCILPSQVSSSVLEILNDHSCVNLTSQVNIFEGNKKNSIFPLYNEIQ